MTNPMTTTRTRIEAQGFLGLDDDTLARINLPLRLSPAICMIWTAVGTAMESHAVLWWLVPFAALGAILPSHPFDVLYNFGGRHLTGGPSLPRYPFRRRFACMLATAMLIGAAWGFQSGLPLVGLIVGWGLVAAAAVNVTTGFCVPSFMVRLMVGPVTQVPSESKVG